MGKRLALWGGLLTGLLAGLVITAPLLAALPSVWNQRDSAGAETDFLRVTYGGGRFVAVGALGQVLVSARGDLWVRTAIPDSCDLTGVAYGAGAYVAVCGTGVPKIFYSTDAMVWTRVEVQGLPAVTSVSYLDGRFLASGSEVWTSPDGITWSKAADANEVFDSTAVAQSSLGGSAFGPPFVTVGLIDGLPDAVMYSEDGALWAGVHLADRLSVTDVAWGPEGFRAVGARGGVLLGSSDGRTWTEVLRIGTPVFGITYGNGEFVWCGSDGIHGVGSDVPAPGTVYDVVFARGTYVAVGADGLVLQSDQVAAPLAAPEVAEYHSYAPAAYPFIASSGAEARPIAVGPAAHGGRSVEIRVALGAFAEPMDVYFGLLAEPLDPETLYVLQPDGTLLSAGTSLVPWRSGSMGPIDTELFGSLPTDLLPPGNYHLFLVVTPEGDSTFSRAIIWETILTVE